MKNETFEQFEEYYEAQGDYASRLMDTMMSESVDDESALFLALNHQYNQTIAQFDIAS